MVKSLRSRMLLVLRWIGVLATVLVLVLLVYSFRRCIYWTSKSCRTQMMLIGGGFEVARAQPDFDPLDSKYPPEPGWYIALWEGSGYFAWLPRLNETQRYRSVVVPLWMLVCILAVLTALLWYRDRRNVRARTAKARRWLAPKRPVHMRLVTWLTFAGLHIVAVAGAAYVETELFKFFGVNFLRLQWWHNLLWRSAFWGFPAFGWVWAQLYLRWRNGLFRDFHPGFCGSCGYDLTGNVTGVCPECGAACSVASSAIAT
jgi:hypothetical protein